METVRLLFARRAKLQPSLSAPSNLTHAHLAKRPKQSPNQLAHSIRLALTKFFGRFVLSSPPAAKLEPSGQRAS